MAKNNFKESATAMEKALLILLPLALVCLHNSADGQSNTVIFAERLDTEILSVEPPSSRVKGSPGNLAVARKSCPDTPTTHNLRQRILDIAVQEWGYFGFNIVDQTETPQSTVSRERRRTAWFGIEESTRLAKSIAGYWSVTPDGSWIIDRQNTVWRGDSGIGARWRDPWSAAFISWVMCEAGITNNKAFRPAIAHHAYIDQAIRARDNNDESSAYRALNVGEEPIIPGDLLCSARQHGYRNLGDRRRYIDEGARTHCDIVVHIDHVNDRILVIGGNVRGRVSMKLLYASVRDKSADAVIHAQVGHEGRLVFAHLKLQIEPPIQLDALLETPTIHELTNNSVTRRALEQQLNVVLSISAS